MTTSEANDNRGDDGAAVEAGAQGTQQERGARGEGRGDGNREGRRDANREGRGEGRGNRARKDQRHHDRPRQPALRRIDLAPPRFNVDELAALTGAPLWQAVHSAVVQDITPAAVFVEVQAMGHAPVRAAVPPSELPGAATGATVRVRLLDPPRGQDAVPTASARQAQALDALDALVNAVDSRTPVPGYAVRDIKGGYSVALVPNAEQLTDDDAFSGSTDGAVRAFLPASQATLFRFGRPREVAVSVGTAATFDIVELEPERANVVVSRRGRLQKERKEQLAQNIASIAEGDVVTATVKTVVPYGAFLEVKEGLDGLLHQTDMSWDGRARPAEMFKVGQRVEVKVLSKNGETGKLKLGFKQLHPDPWSGSRTVFSEGAVVKGTIVALADFGAFVRLPLPNKADEHVEGLIHVSEISWQRIKHPSQRFQIGQDVDVKVLGMDTQARRISLSTRALERNPFEVVAEKFPIGTVVKAKIKSLADFGAFIELAEGVDGLIHVGEISWTEHPNHPSELLTIGQEVECVVMNVDLAKQRVGCSIKRTTANPFDGWEQKYHRGARLKLKVIRVDERGAWLEVEPGLTCFCPTRDLIGSEGDGRVERASEAVKMGKMIDVEVRSFDRRFKKVSVSARAVVENDTRQAYQEYQQKEKQASQALNPLADKLRAFQNKQRSDG